MPGAVVDSVGDWLRMDHISHSSEPSLGYSPVRARARTIVMRPTLPHPLQLYMSLPKLHSRPRRSPPSRRLLLLNMHLHPRLLRPLLPQLSERPGAVLHEPESVVQDHPRNVQRYKNRAASSEEVGPFPEASPAPADHSYDHAESDCFSSFSFEAGPSGASDIACEGGQSPSSHQAIVNH